MRVHESAHQAGEWVQVILVSFFCCLGCPVLTRAARGYSSLSNKIAPLADQLQSIWGLKSGFDYKTHEAYPFPVT